jgi:hypothetical protein
MADRFTLPTEASASVSLNKVSGDPDTLGRPSGEPSLTVYDD